MPDTACQSQVPDLPGKSFLEPVSWLAGAAGYYKFITLHLQTWQVKWEKWREPIWNTLPPFWPMNYEMHDYCDTSRAISTSTPRFPLEGSGSSDFDPQRAARLIESRLLLESWRVLVPTRPYFIAGSKAANRVQPLRGNLTFPIRCSLYLPTHLEVVTSFLGTYHSCTSPSVWAA